jgi:hypothetical protein
MRTGRTDFISQSVGCSPRKAEEIRLRDLTVNALSQHIALRSLSVKAMVVEGAVCFGLAVKCAAFAPIPPVRRRRQVRLAGSRRLIVEPLIGQRASQRSIRLSRQWRAIYEVQSGSDVVLVLVKEVMPHDY